MSRPLGEIDGRIARNTTSGTEYSENQESLPGRTSTTKPRHLKFLWWKWSSKCFLTPTGLPNHLLLAHSSMKFSHDLVLSFSRTRCFMVEKSTHANQ